MLKECLQRLAASRGYTSGTALARALNEAGHVVSIQAVCAWLAGTTVPKQENLLALDQLLKLTREERAELAAAFVGFANDVGAPLGESPP